MAAARETSLEAIRRKFVPLSAYWIKDFVKQIVTNSNFHDSLATSFAYLSLYIAFPFLPLPFFIPFLALVFVLTFIHPLLGLMALLLLTLPMLIYQAPLLAWLAMIFISVGLILGYKHYRSIAYAYALTVLPLSYLGYLLEIPGLVLSVLVLGFKRGAILGAFAILLMIILSNLADIPLSGPIVYNSVAGHSLVQNVSFATYFTASKQAASLGNIQSQWSSAVSTFFSFEVAGHVLDSLYYAALAVAFSIQSTLIQILVWVFVAFSVGNYAVKSRSPYKGTLASLFGAVLLASYFFLSNLLGLPFNYLLIASFLLTPVGIFALEASNINVVLALDVMKQDILGKFGVAFEDLTHGSNETLDDVADYDETKKEFKQAILAPIEHREIAGAYNVRPAKGILLFGPPGTGKTLIMRALANEIRAGFFYVKASSLLSPYAGESAQALSKIFATAKKHAPCVLFFDEIDNIASRRELQESASGRELITTLLTEMDGFQKISGVVIVGATNAPQLLDPSILRPGRFDKIVYMPLPDQAGRAAILKHYLSHLPVGKDMDYDKLASLTQRFSPADIKNISDEVSRQVADSAITKHEMLMIRMVDVVRVIKSMKPSTSLAQIEDYNTFRMDYERRAHPEAQVEKERKVSLNDVVDLEEAKKALSEAVEIPILHPELVKKYDVGHIKGVLLFGPPGVGKTMLVQAFTNDLSGVRMLAISGSDISKYGPEKAAAVIKEIFDRAKENAPAIIFVDEIDTVVPSREKAGEAFEQISGEFLQEFDTIKDTTGIVIIAATNRPDVLDPALLRAGRFDRLIFMPPPDKESRQRIFEDNLEKAPIAKDVDFGALAEATEGYTGADIANICRQAKVNALESSLTAGKEVQISNGDMTKLLQRTKPSAPALALGRYLTFFSKYGKR